MKNKSKSQIKFLCFAALFLFAGLGLLRAATFQYVVVDLGDFGDLYGPFSRAGGINSEGQVCGWATDTNGGVDAFFYDGQLHNLGAGYAYGLNDDGVVVGSFSGDMAFYNADHTTNGDVAIPQLQGGTYGNGALGINNSGVIVGNSYLDNHTTQNPNAYSYQYPSGSLQDLGDILGTGNTSYYSVGYAINGNGVIAGVVEGTAYPGYYYPAVDSGSGFQTLPLLSGDLGGAAYGINSSGVIVGQSGDDDGAGTARAVYWSGSNVFALTATNVPGTAYGINDSGEMVGYYYTNSESQAFLYANGGLMNLNSLVAPGKMADFQYLTQGTAINDSGDIVGYGMTTNGHTFAFLATPSTGSGGASPSIFMDEPVLTNRQVLLNFSVTNLVNASYTLLQTTQLVQMIWTTNVSAILTTNVLNVSYRFTVTNNGANQFFRVRSP